MTQFDAIKALQEEITGLIVVKTVITHRVNSSQKTMVEAETEHNALVKLEGFASAELERKRQVLEALKEARDRGQ